MFEVSELSGPKEFFREDRVALDLRGSRLALRKQAPVTGVARARVEDVQLFQLIQLGLIQRHLCLLSQDHQIVGPRNSVRVADDQRFERLLHGLLEVEGGVTVQA